MAARGSPLLAFSSRSRSFAAFLGFTILSALWIGIHLALRPGAQFVGDGADPTFVIWSFAWWPHAILHGLNPFVTRAVWAPDGVNLMWVGSVPALSILFAPLTLAFGPIAAYNAATMIVPGFAAWTAFALCRFLTRSFWPSIVGGFLFGCSGFELLHTESSHIGLTGAGALVPLIALAALRFVSGEISGRGLVLRVAPLVALELLLSTELLFTTALGLAAAFGFAFLLAPACRPSLVRLPRYVISAYVLAGIITAPFVYYLLTGFQKGSFASPASFTADLLTFVAPTGSVLVGGAGVASAITRAFPGLAAEPEAYVGLPTVLVVALYAFQKRRVPAARLVVVLFAFAVVATLGPDLWAGGNHLLALPWGHIDRLPLFDNILPVRLSVYVELLGGVVVALWISATPPGLIRWALPVLAILLALPRPTVFPTTDLSVEPFFTDSSYANCLDSGETILPLPITGLGESMIWQVKSGFHFNIAGGFTGLYTPAGFKTPAGVHYVTDGYHLSAYQALDVKEFIKAKHVGAVVVAGNEADFFSGALNRLATPQSVGGVVLYNFESAPPSCLGP